MTGTIARSPAEGTGDGDRRARGAPAMPTMPTANRREVCATRSPLTGTIARSPPANGDH
ncbi:hypothetical protein AB0F91_12150 [Amycolatopsis sp. NPDC023774]|uniref:hypothetical protein n=1 Tax=Amycolatopsis sp. NPDC023774 TaxID=3155015 RepID=UPI003411500A